MNKIDAKIELECNKYNLSNIIFIIYLSIVTFLYFHFINEYCFNSYTENYAISDLLIHYDGEFIRRGFIGTVLLYLSNFFDFELKNIIKYFFYAVYLFYFFIYFTFLKKLVFKSRILLLFIIFSPIGILYPLYELESLLRKEIFLYTFYLSYLIILENKINQKLIILYLSLILPLLILIHDGFIFFIPIFFLTWIIYKDTKSYKTFISDMIFPLLTILLVTILHIQYIFYGNTPGYVDQIVSNLSNYDYDTKKFAAFIWLERDLKDALMTIFINLNINNFFRFILLILLSFIPILYIFKKVRVINKEIKIIFLLTLLSFSLIFIIALDWGRFMTVIFNLIMFFLVFSIKKYNKFSNLKFKNDLMILLFLIIYCSTWSPKTTFLEKINLLPPKDVIERILLSLKA